MSFSMAVGSTMIQPERESSACRTLGSLRFVTDLLGSGTNKMAKVISINRESQYSPLQPQLETHHPNSITLAAAA